jgi:hypothetical protein
MNKHLLRQAQELQARLAKAQEELADMTVEVSAGGGAVTLVMDGRQRVHSVKISPQAVDPQDIGLLEDLMLTAINQAVQKSQEMAQSHLGQLTSGFKFPGLK